MLGCMFPHDAPELPPACEKKTCTKCGAEKSLDKFYTRKNSKGLRVAISHCKACRNTDRVTHLRGPGRDANRKRSREMNARRKALLNEIKDVPCADCGMKYPPYVMDFDHRDPSQKEFGIGTQKVRFTIKRLMAEIEKCDIVCANCHRIRTHSQGYGQDG